MEEGETRAGETFGQYRSFGVWDSLYSADLGQDQSPPGTFHAHGQELLPFGSRFKRSRSIGELNVYRPACGVDIS